MSTTSIDAMNEFRGARRRVETYCQSLVDAGEAQWRVNDDGDTELHMESGELYIFGELSVTRLK